ncbi:glycosyl hydrolase family 17 [Flavobacterium sp.]|uniref:glycoside hydrolase family 17 protein n=1 Tax=Flavobacterium sp. TaxID=239 RepID=UPI0026073491|nr:glycosyl hydrolase family 17 [Flavobacterium sp.]
MRISSHISLSKILKSIVLGVVLCAQFSCKSAHSREVKTKYKEVTAKDILGNPKYSAICYGGYRQNSRDIQPTTEEVKEDLRILSALNIKVIRTYNVHLAEASTVLKAIQELKKEDANFEMYVMLGAWIDCKNAWTNQEPNHFEESERNEVEIKEAVRLANQYPDIIKILAVGNEAMVKWATSYFVQANVILKWVNHLQNLKKENKLDQNLWITSSDDFASWGGLDESYKTKDLEALVNAVDYVSMHTYPYHNSHYNPNFWKVPANEASFSEIEKVNAAMNRSVEFAKNQYNTVKNYVRSINPSKPIHIGETGWASNSDGFYGNEGSKASDEYKQASYYKAMRNWTDKEGISCFFFEAFDEPWKDSGNPKGSENHFGLITVDGKVKFALWENSFSLKSLKRNGNSIVKTFNGSEELLMKTVQIPPSH